MRVVGKTKALEALAGVPRACNESGSAQRVTSGTKVSTAARGRQIAGPRLLRFDRALSWQLDAALYLEEHAGAAWSAGWRRLAAAAVGSPSAQVAPMTNPERVDRAEILRHLGLIASPGQVIEVRAVGRLRTGIIGSPTLSPVISTTMTSWRQRWQTTSPGPKASTSP